MLSINEFSKSLKAALYERVSSPLAGSIAISWLYFNWKGIAYFFSSNKNIEDKLITIASDYSEISINICYPLLAGFIVSLIIPVASTLPFFIQERINGIKINYKRKYENQQLLPINFMESFREELEEKNITIKDLELTHQEEKNRLTDEFDKKELVYKAKINRNVLFSKPRHPWEYEISADLLIILKYLIDAPLTFDQLIKCYDHKLEALKTEITDDETKNILTTAIENFLISISNKNKLNTYKTTKLGEKCFYFNREMKLHKHMNPE